MTRAAPNTPNNSPLKLIVTLAALIFAAETLVMFLLELLAIDSPLADAAILTALISPVLYLFVFRPLIREIAERRRVAMALADSEAQTRQITEAAVDAFIVMDARGVIIDWNTAAENVFGWSRAEAIGLNLEDTIIPLQMQEAHQRGLAHFLATGEGSVIGKRLELTARHRDGHELLVEITISANRAGDSWRFATFMHDITRRRQLEDVVLRSENRYRTLFDSSRDAVMTLAPPTWKFTSGNAATVAMFEARDEEHFMTLEPWEFSPERQPDGRASDEKAKEMIETAMRNGYHFFEWTHRRISGEAFPATVFLSRMEIDGKAFLQATVRDITEQKQSEEALREIRVQLAHAMSVAQLVAWEYDVASGLFTFSEPYYALHGTTAELEGGLQMSAEVFARKFVHPDDAHVVADEIGKAVATADPAYRKQLESRIFRRNGELRYVLVYITIAKDADGKTVQIHGANQDITERKRIEAAMAQLNRQVRTILDSVGEGILGLDLNGNHTFINPAAATMLGYEVKELIGAPSHSTWHHTMPDGRPYPREDCPIYSAFKDGLVHRVDTDVFWRKDGTSFPADYTSTPVRDEQCVLQGAVVVFRDITERTRVEKALREKENLLSDSQRLGHVGSWFWNMTGPMIWSEEMYRLYGVSPDTFTPTPESLLGLIHPEDRQAMQHWLSVCAAGAKHELVFRINHPDGTIRFILGRGESFHDGQSRLIHMAGTVQDITERIHAEEVLQAKNKELEQVTYAVSHDLRSPLVTIQTFLGHLEQDISAQDESHMAKDLNFIQTASDKMGQLLDELGKLLRVGQQANPPEDVPLQDVVKEALDLVAGRISHLGIPVTVAPESITLHGDRAHFVAIFQNLVDNACKFMGHQPAPRIDIGVEMRGAEKVFFVRDNGDGIELHRQAEMFGLFVRLNPHVEGTGLGLALVKRIVELYDGRVWVESAGLGRGACFYLTLPGAGGKV